MLDLIHLVGVLWVCLVGYLRACHDDWLMVITCDKAVE